MTPRQGVRRPLLERPRARATRLHSALRWRCQGASRSGCSVALDGLCGAAVAPPSPSPSCDGRETRTAGVRDRTEGNEGKSRDSGRSSGLRACLASARRAEHSCAIAYKNACASSSGCAVMIAATRSSRATFASTGDKSSSSSSSSAAAISLRLSALSRSTTSDTTRSRASSVRIGFHALTMLPPVRDRPAQQVARVAHAQRARASRFPRGQIPTVAESTWSNRTAPPVGRE